MIYREQILPLSSLVRFWGNESEISEELDPCFDSRKYQQGQLFWCLSGDRFDAFVYVEEVLKQSCPFVVFQLSPESERKAEELFARFPNVFFLGVPNSEVYLQELAKKSMTSWKADDSRRLVVSLTGSNGKTTTKEMLVHLAKSCLGSCFSSTQGNLNNHLGVPMTILSGSKTDELRIIEMGTNHPGEIEFLTDIAQPDTGIITCIGDAHLEFFKDRSGVFKEKSNLYFYVKNYGRRAETFVVNGDDEHLVQLKDVLQFSEKEDADWNLSLSGACLTLKYQDKSFEITNRNILGHHNFKNLAAAFALMYQLYPQKDKELLAAANSFAPSYNRSCFVDVGASRVFLDAYNANPSSMTLALTEYIHHIQELPASMDETLFVMGDMNELGPDESSTFHQHLGKLLAQEGGLHVIFVGRFARDYLKGFGEQGDASLFASCADISPEFWKDQLVKYKNIFIKGSRSIALEQLLKY